MGEDRLDKFFREQLKSHETEVNPLDIWDGIEQKSGRKKDDRKFFYLIFGVLFIGLISFSIYYFSNSNTDLSKNYSSTANNTNLIEDKESIQSQNETTDKLNTLETDKNDLNDDSVKSPLLSSDKEISQSINQKNTIQNLSTKTNNIGERLNNIKEGNLLTKRSDLKNIQQSQITIAGEPKIQAKNILKAEDNISANPNELDQLSSKNTIAQTLKSDNRKLEENLESNFANAENNIQNIDLLNNISVQPLNQIRIFNPPNLAILTINKGSEAIRKKTVDPKLNHGFYLNLEPQYSIKSISSESNSYEELIRSRNNSETSLESFSIGMGYKIQHKSGLYGTLGISYNQISERFDLTSSSDTSYIAADQLIQIHIDINGDTTPIYGAAEVMETTTYTKKIYNYHRSFDIPVTIGYQWTLDNGIGLLLESGIGVNLSYTNKGQILNQFQKPIDVANQDDLFVDNLGLSYLIKFGLSKPLNDRTSILFLPSYRAYLNPITKNNYVLKQRYAQLGASIQVAYMLN